jgi:hypothetical protein
MAKSGRFDEFFLYPMIVAMFFGSGFAALIYQIIWQRALFTIFGINVEAVTVVVPSFSWVWDLAACPAEGCRGPAPFLCSSSLV